MTLGPFLSIFLSTISAHESFITVIKMKMEKLGLLFLTITLNLALRLFTNKIHHTWGSVRQGA